MQKSPENKLTLVTTKPCFGLPTACPKSLTIYLYLKFANIPFHLSYNSTCPDSDQIPYVESGSYVANNNEKGGVIECLREDGIVDLDSDFRAILEWVSMKAMISSWLMDALTYELWIASPGIAANKIYYSDLPWPIGSTLYHKQVKAVKHYLGITNENAERVETEMYRRANLAYGGLLTQLGDEAFLFGDRPSSLDALFLSHALIVLKALPETSGLRSKLLTYDKLVKYAERLSGHFIEEVSVQSATPTWLRTSSSNGRDSSSIPKEGGFSSWRAKPKNKAKKERSKEENILRRRSHYFLAAQVVSVIVFLSLFGGSDGSQMELDLDDEGVDYMEKSSAFFRNLKISAAIQEFFQTPCSQWK